MIIFGTRSVGAVVSFAVVVFARRPAARSARTWKSIFSENSSLYGKTAKLTSKASLIKQVLGRGTALLGLLTPFGRFGNPYSKFSGAGLTK